MIKSIDAGHIGIVYRNDVILKVLTGPKTILNYRSDSIEVCTLSKPTYVLSSDQVLINENAEKMLMQHFPQSFRLNVGEIMLAQRTDSPFDCELFNLPGVYFIPRNYKVNIEPILSEQPFNLITDVFPFNISAPMISQPTLRLLLDNNIVQVVNVQPHQQVVVFVDGKLAHHLLPGRYFFTGSALSVGKSMREWHDRVRKYAVTNRYDNLNLRQPFENVSTADCQLVNAESDCLINVENLFTLCSNFNPADIIVGGDPVYSESKYPTFTDLVYDIISLVVRDYAASVSLKQFCTEPFRITQLDLLTERINNRLEHYGLSISNFRFEFIAVAKHEDAD